MKKQNPSLKSKKLLCVKDQKVKKIINRREEYITLSETELKEKYGEKGWKRLPDQIVTKLEHIPACFEVVTYHIAVYAPKRDDSEQSIIRAPKPAELWEGSIVTPTLLSSIMTAKYLNAMPLYRQEQMYKARCKEDASVLDMKVVSALCKEADRMLYGIDFEVAKNVDTQYIADELAEYIVENYQ